MPTVDARHHRPRGALLLAVGSALCATALASASGFNPLAYSTLDAANGNISLGPGTGTFNFAGPSSTYVNQALAGLPGGGWSGSLTAFTYYSNATYALEMFSVSINAPTSYSSVSCSVSFTVTISQSATFSGFSTPGQPSWTANGGPVSDGDVLAAGQYIFSGPASDSASLTGYGVGFQLTFSLAPAIPLPGAASLAACGLLAPGRRRRR